MTTARVLWDLRPTEVAVIVSLDPVITKKYETRLRDLGFSVGETVICLRWLPFGGPRVFRIADSVLSIDRDVAQSVTVKTEGSK